MDLNVGVIGTDIIIYSYGQGVIHAENFTKSDAKKKNKRVTRILALVIMNGSKMKPQLYKPQSSKGQQFQPPGALHRILLNSPKEYNWRNNRKQGLIIENHFSRKLNANIPIKGKRREFIYNKWFVRLSWKYAKEIIKIAHDDLNEINPQFDLIRLDKKEKGLLLLNLMRTVQTKLLKSSFRDLRLFITRMSLYKEIHYIAYCYQGHPKIDTKELKDILFYVWLWQKI